MFSGLVFAGLAVASAAHASAATPAPAASGCAETQPAIVKAAQPGYPASSMRFVQSPVSVQVMVMVDANGSVATASVAQSSGYADVDASALKAAMASTYRPRMVHCKPAEGLYLFNATFAPH